jgi:type IV pilus assembly protein PilV
MNHVKHPMKRQSGMTLIEVLVAILIFSFGLLGFVGLQARAIQFSTSAEDSNRAALLANEITSQMVLAQTVNLPAAAVTAWQARASDPTVGLPNAAASTAALSASSASITITWRAPKAAAGTANSVNQYVTQVVLP